jgi:rhodanese-related sulfurtransferase
MKPSISFGIKTAIIIGVSVGLALAFNAARPDRLPLVQDPEVAAQIAVQRGEISLADAILLFQSGQAVFVDARDAEEFALGHIEGALSLDPLSFGQHFPALREQVEGMTVVTYCDGELCELSHELAEQLKSMGLQDVRVLKNGWTLWRDQGLPTATGSQAAPQDAAHEKVVEEHGGDDAEATVPITPESMESAPAEESPLPELPENAPKELEPTGITGTNEPEQLNLPQEHAPLDLPSQDQEPLQPASPQPAPVEQTPADLAPSEPTPLEPTPQEMPSPQPDVHDANPPVSETQGEQS